MNDRAGNIAENRHISKRLENTQVFENSGKLAMKLQFYRIFENKNILN